MIQDIMPCVYDNFYILIVLSLFYRPAIRI